MIKLPYFSPDAELLEVCPAAMLLDASLNATAPELLDEEDWSEIW